MAGMDILGPMNKQQMREIRTELNMTQEQLAKRLDINWRTVARWEAGAKIPETVRLALREVLRQEGRDRSTLEY